MKKDAQKFFSGPGSTLKIYFYFFNSFSILNDFQTLRDMQVVRHGERFLLGSSGFSYCEFSHEIRRQEFVPRRNDNVVS